jgi:hypothetical protein
MQTPPFSNWAITVVPVALLSVCLATFLEYRRLKKPSEIGGYRWGYFFGFFDVFWLLTAPLGIAGYIQFQFSHNPIGIIGVCGAYLGRFVIGLFIIRRKKWAWIWGTILGMAGFQGAFTLLTPLGLIATALIWSGNFSYAKERWRGAKWIGVRAERVNERFL